MNDWVRYNELRPGPRHTVVGDVHVLGGVHNDTFPIDRALTVCLPPSYEHSATRTFPVISIMDGQNLFDEAQAHSGQWRADEDMEELASGGVEAIVVGVDNGGPERANEYSPVVDADGGGRAGKFVGFLIETVKSLVAQRFRVSRRREETFLFGSSMGALISLYAQFERPDVFGGFGAMSPSAWHGSYGIFDHLATEPACGARIYVDVGTREMFGRH